MTHEAALGGVSQVSWVFDASEPCLADHFPGKPIVPAFLQLERIRQEILRLLGSPAHVIKLKSVKFLQVVPPGNEVLLTVRQARPGGGVSFELSVAAEVVTRGEVGVA